MHSSTRSTLTLLAFISANPPIGAISAAQILVIYIHLFLDVDAKTSGNLSQLQCTSGRTRGHAGKVLEGQALMRDLAAL